MTDEELRAIVEQNSQGVADIQQTLSSLISDAIAPMSEAISTTLQQLEEFQQRFEASQQRIEENSEVSREAAKRSLENAELFRTLLAEAREDRMTNQRRYDEQMDIIRSMLARFTAMDNDSASND